MSSGLASFLENYWSKTKDRVASVPSERIHQVRVGTAKHLWIDWIESRFINNDNMAPLFIQSIHRSDALQGLDTNIT